MKPDEQDNEHVCISPGADPNLRMVLDHGGEHPSHWTAVFAVASKIWCSAHTLNKWGKKAKFKRLAEPQAAGALSVG